MALFSTEHADLIDHQIAQNPFLMHLFTPNTFESEFQPPSQPLLNSLLIGFGHKICMQICLAQFGNQSHPVLE